jgi:hypothetical protein
MVHRIAGRIEPSCNSRQRVRRINTIAPRTRTVALKNEHGLRRRRRRDCARAEAPDEIDIATLT